MRRTGRRPERTRWNVLGLGAELLGPRRVRSFSPLSSLETHIEIIRNLRDELEPSRIPLLAAYAGSTVTREASRMTFNRMRRAMQTSDMLQEVGPAYEMIFGEGRGEAENLRWAGKRRDSKA